MLGRKQSVRKNEDWKNALDHIEETVSKKELDSLVKKTVKDIKEKCKGKKAAYAWSAGKDSLVLGEICEKAGIDQSVLVRCNLEYPAFIAWIEQNKPSGLEVINTGQDMEWLKKHQDMLFPDKSNKAAQWFHNQLIMERVARKSRTRRTNSQQKSRMPLKPNQRSQRPEGLLSALNAVREYGCKTLRIKH